MKRRLVQQGAATMMVSLPAKWIKQNGLKKGDEVEISPEASSLVIGVEQSKLIKEANVKLTSNTETSVRTFIANLYRIGYDIITVNYDNNIVYPIIENVVNNQLLGFEITEKGDNFVKIENITEPDNERYDTIFNRILFNIQEVLDSVENNSNIDRTEQKIKQLDNFCRRVLVKKNEESSSPLWVFHAQMDHAQRDIYHLTNYLKKNKSKLTSEEKEILEMVKDIFSDVKKGYLKKDIKILEKDS